MWIICLESTEENFYVLLPYMSKVAILVNRSLSFELPTPLDRNHHMKFGQNQPSYFRRDDV